MPETPDFEKLARYGDLQATALEWFGAHHAHCKATGVVTRVHWRGTDTERVLCDCGLAEAIAANAEQLRQIWNARGAADIVKADGILCPSPAAPYAETVDRAIRSLDR